MPWLVMSRGWIVVGADSSVTFQVAPASIGVRPTRTERRGVARGDGELSGADRAHRCGNANKIGALPLRLIGAVDGDIEARKPQRGTQRENHHDDPAETLLVVERPSENDNRRRNAEIDEVRQRIELGAKARRRPVGRQIRQQDGEDSNHAHQCAAQQAREHEDAEKRDRDQV